MRARTIDGTQPYSSTEAGQALDIGFGHEGFLETLMGAPRKPSHAHSYSSDFCSLTPEFYLHIRAWRCNLLRNLAKAVQESLIIEVLSARVKVRFPRRQAWISYWLALHPREFGRVQPIVPHRTVQDRLT